MFLPKNPQKTDVHKSRFSMWFIILHQNERMFSSREWRMIERMKLRQWRWREQLLFVSLFTSFFKKREKDLPINTSYYSIHHEPFTLKLETLAPPLSFLLFSSLHFFLQSSPFFSIFFLVFSFSASFSSPVIHAHLTGFPWEKGEESEREREK